MSTVRMRRDSGCQHYRPWGLYYLLVQVSDGEQGFVSDVVRLQGRNPIDYVVLNAGILKYPNVSGASL
jgi:hypothetical protein